MEPPRFNMRDILFSIHENSLDSCLSKIRIKDKYLTPGSSYDIITAYKVDDNFVFKYYSDKEYE